MSGNHFNDVGDDADDGAGSVSLKFEGCLYDLIFFSIFSAVRNPESFNLIG